MNQTRKDLNRNFVYLNGAEIFNQNGSKSNSNDYTNVHPTINQKNEMTIIIWAGSLK